MFKVVLWDYTGESAQWAKNFLKDDVEVIRTLRPDDSDQAEVIMRGDWNFVLIFEQGQRELFNEIFKTMREMKVSTKNIVFAKDFNSWLRNPAAVYALMKPETCDNFYRHWNFFSASKRHKYISASTEGLHYLATADDRSIMAFIYLFGAAQDAHLVKYFLEKSKKYYNVDVSGGIFLDIGANIGTASIYLLKKLAPNMRTIAFEPDAENFKLLRINTILNDAENNSTLVNCGLGETFDEMTMHRNLENPGNNSLIRNAVLRAAKDDLPTETIQIIPLDAYLAENKIAAQEIKYIWIDTEGYEAQVLLGAKNLLKENPVPIFMEVNPVAWDESGKLQPLINLLKEVGYTHYIWTGDSDTWYKKVEKLFPIDKLWELRNKNEPTGQLGDIFLVRNLT